MKKKEEKQGDNGDGRGAISVKAEVVPAEKPQDSLTLQLRPDSAEALIARAIDKAVPIEVMEKLMAMRRELKAESAREAYFAALARFQAECPVVVKTEAVTVSGKVRYRYAPLDEIVKVVREALKQNGFSYHIETEQAADQVAAICVSHHVGGHAERTRFAVPIAHDAYMNAAQHVASALTYAKRYAVCNAFGILTGDEDDDARTTSSEDAASRQSDADEKTRAAAQQKHDLKKQVSEAFDNPAKKPAPTEASTKPVDAFTSLMGRAGNLKESLGESDYYHVLKGYGVEHANKLSTARLAEFVTNLESFKKAKDSDAAQRQPYLECAVKAKNILGEERFNYHLGGTGVEKVEELGLPELKAFIKAIAPEVTAKRDEKRQ